MRRNGVELYIIGRNGRIDRIEEWIYSIWTDAREVGEREREIEEKEVEERGVFKALGIPKFVVLRSITWCCKGIVQRSRIYKNYLYT